jgi:outer membrane protein assembly factor BamB
VVLPDGNVMTTCLYFDSILIIDKNTGDIKWRWGKGELAHPHNPNILDNGNILVFDNGLHRPMSYPSYSRVLEIEPESGKIVWEYKDKIPWNFYSSFISGAQRLPNGNTLICEGAKGRFFEVTREGETVWEYRNPFYFDTPILNFGINNRVFRTHRYDPEYPGLKGRGLDPKKFNGLNFIYGVEGFKQL